LRASVRDSNAETVVCSAADVTPSCRKFEATSTVMPEIRMLAGPLVEAVTSVNDRTPGDSRIGALRNGAAPTMNDTDGVAWKLTRR